MAKSKEIAFFAALTVGSLTACTSDSPFSVPRPNAPAAADQNGDGLADEFDGGTITRQLLAEDAPVNLIFMPVSNKIKPELAENEALWEKDDRRERKRFLRGDFEYRQGILNTISYATGDRYKPSSITFAKTGAIALAGCISNKDYGQIDEIHAYAEPYRKPDAINVIVVDQPGCLTDDIGRIGGFAGPGDDPIMTGDTYFALDSNIVHEIGHSAGLAHAGTTMCEQPAAIQNCLVEETTDPNSIMSYENGLDSYDFTMPELMQMGLLNPDEVIEATESGEYALSPGNAPGPKVLMLETSAGKLFISEEHDEYASYDEKCVVGFKVKLMSRKDFLYFKQNRIDGRMQDVTCTKANERLITRTVQVRTNDGDSLNIVGQTHEFKDKQITSKTIGVYEDNTLLYEDSELVVIFKHFTGPDQAVIQVNYK